MQLKLWMALLGHWGNMLIGSSYWHASQGLGLHFQPDKLQDYYRDYSTKVDWNGPIDESSFPLVQEPGGKPFLDPITLAQKALGHWSCWLNSQQQDDSHQHSFLHLAQWFVVSQEPQGSWVLPSMQKAIYLVPYSALAQGQAVSVLIRAFSITSEEKFLEAARQGLRFMLKSIHEGGTCRNTPLGPIFEEYPQRLPNTVLNGWISALFGLYDVSLADSEFKDCETLESTLTALARMLHQYDAGYWSFYDSSGALASPYYHKVHITQLKALELTFPHYATIMRKFRVRFEEQMASYPCSTKAFVTKAFQKLRQPPPTVRIHVKRP